MYIYVRHMLQQNRIRIDMLSFREKNMTENINVWQDWQIVRKLGEGGFGKVYEIVRNRYSIEEHRALKRRVAGQAHGRKRRLHCRDRVEQPEL